MGEVYRARDSRLDRTVALKTINSAVVGNPELKARLLREAHAISHVQHPHICALYDMGAQDETDYLVMEYGICLNARRTLLGKLDRQPRRPEVPRGGFCRADQITDAHQSGDQHF